MQIKLLRIICAPRRGRDEAPPADVGRQYDFPVSFPGAEEMILFLLGSWVIGGLGFPFARLFISMGDILSLNSAGNCLD